MNPSTENNTFSRENRLNKPDDLYSVYRKGSVFSTSWLSLRYIKRTEDEKAIATGLFKYNSSSRLGVLIKRKVFKRASDRNYFKRIGREIFRSKKCSFSVQYDIVLSAEKRPSCFTRNYIRKEVEALFIKGNLI